MLTEPKWLTRQSIDVAHELLIDEHGGSHGVRDELLIESALARPRNRFAYAGPDCDLADLAAAYGYGLVKNHGYIDGNKRIALAALLLFLRRNGHRLLVSVGEAARTMEGVAAGMLGEDELAGWVRERLEQSG